MKEVLLVSGGINSTVMMYRELMTKGHEIHPLAIDYGQKNLGRERTALLKTWGHLDSIVDERTKDRLKSIKFLDVSIMRYLFRSALTFPDIQIPDYDTSPGGDHNPTIVPYRDPFFISIAAVTANLVDAQRILIGNNNMSIKMFDALKELVSAASKNEMKLEVPFAEMKKEEIMRMGMILQVPFELTSGCFRDKAHACGTCDNCHERKRAFREAMIEDRTIYVDDVRAKRNCCG